MSHSPDTVAAVLQLRQEGLGARRISARTGVPIATIAEWLRGNTPQQPTACPHCRRPEDLPPEYVYLLGMYLGDGCISTHPRTYKLRIKLDVRYPQIVAECERAMRAVMPSNRVRRLTREGSWSEVYAYSRHWPCVFPQHGLGRKHSRPIEVTNWQIPLIMAAPEQFLRGLIHSDGCRFENTGRNGWRAPRYSFSNRSEDIRILFCWVCELLGLHWTEAPHTIYVSRKADVARMDEFIGPKA
ncbi:MAG: hypothetical protein QOJ29_4231 [Thermoleophilaceae bacterium]|nr:hypothetical protein [Thermoleophilaceae bacterium]